MRNFLPIKGPGGRALTPKEKVALCVLGVTLVLCVLTMLAGEGAYLSGEAQNPVFAVVAAICRVFGGGVIGLYALVTLWSGLIYFKGERIADVAPVAGRLLATFAVMVGISGALGVAHVHTAGALGNLVGGSLGSVLGGTIGISILLGLMLLGVHLAGQGAWGALREPVPGVAQGFYAATPMEAAGGRMGSEPRMPDDGDPTPDERTLAVTQAMEEIERSHGVTIVDVDETPESEFRPSIGEEVEAAPQPQPHTEEAEIQRGLREVSEALAREEQAASQSRLDEVDDDEDDEDPRYYEPVYQVIDTREPEPAEEIVEVVEVVEAAERDTEEDDLEDDDEDDERMETGFATTVDEDEHEPEPETAEEAEHDDPYARGGLIKRLKEQREGDVESGAERPYASFDWRGRPLD